MATIAKVYTKRDISFKQGLWVDELGTPITGIKKSFYNNGTVQDETTVENGVYNGIQRVYDQTGHVWWENTWKDNVIVKYKKIP
jgi:antitoxin component YwqK of YwqJK toxin-antitoxin module